MQRRVAQMGVTLDTGSNSLTNDNRQSSKVRFEAERVNVGKSEGVSNILKHNTSKGVHFKPHQMDSESSGHLKGKESNAGEKGNQHQQQRSPLLVKRLPRQEEEPVLQENVEEEELGQRESNSSGMLTKSFLQLLQAGDSPQDQRRQVMGVFQSNPKLLKDYLKSREPGYLLPPVQHQDFQGHSGFKGLPLPWKDEGERPPNIFNVREQMRGQQPVWFQQQQQLVGGQLKLLPATLVKDGAEFSYQQLQPQPPTLQQQAHVVGGAQFEGQPVRQMPRNLLQHPLPTFARDF